MTVRLPPSEPNGSSEVWNIDFRETAPALSNKTMYDNRIDASWLGALAVGVPGELKGLEEAHKRWGSLPWSRLVQPSVDLAEGWNVGKELAYRIQLEVRCKIFTYCNCAILTVLIYQSFRTIMVDNPVWRAIFAPKGTPLLAGEFVQRLKYARTLRTIAEEGAGAFYEVCYMHFVMIY